MLNPFWAFNRRAKPARNSRERSQEPSPRTPRAPRAPTSFAKCAELRIFPIWQRERAWPSSARARAGRRGAASQVPNGVYLSRPPAAPTSLGRAGRPALSLPPALAPSSQGAPRGTPLGGKPRRRHPKASAACDVVARAHRYVDNQAWASSRQKKKRNGRLQPRTTEFLGRLRRFQ